MVTGGAVEAVASLSTGSRHSSPLRLSSHHQKERNPLAKAVVVNGIHDNNNNNDSSFHDDDDDHDLNNDDGDHYDDDDDDNDDDDPTDASTTICCYCCNCCSCSWLEYMWAAFGMPKILQLMANWEILIFGQILSFMLAAGGASQSALYVNCHLATPTTFTLAFVYFFLSLHLIPIYFSSNNNNNGKRNNDGNIVAAVATSDHEEDEDDDDNDDDNDERNNKKSMNGSNNKIDNLHEARLSSGTCNGGDVSVDNHLVGGGAVVVEMEELEEVTTVRRRGSFFLEGPAWAYFCMALLDVESNYFTVLAFQYTTLTSVTLFDALAIPSAMILSRLFLRRRYTNFHLLGVLLCMVGVLVNVFQDYDADHGGGSGGALVKNVTNSSSSSPSSSLLGNATAIVINNKNGAQELPHKLRGDILAITGGILYGFNDFLCELSVRHLGGPNEYLGMMGLFALIISSIQAFVLERHQIVEFWHTMFQHEHDSSSPSHQHHHHDRQLDLFLPEGGVDGGDDTAEICSASITLAVWIFYVVISVLGYIGGARFLTMSEAAFYNLSLLTGDLWSVAFSIIDEGIVPLPLFYLALFLITGGVLLYETAPSPIQDDHHPTSGATLQQHHDVVTCITPSSRRKRDKRKNSMLRLIGNNNDNVDENGDLEMPASSSSRRINHHHLRVMT